MEEQKKDEKLNKEAATPQADGQAELEKLKAERDEYLNGWKRAKADLINYQKDEAKRFEEMMRYGNEAIIRDLIAVLDSFRLGIGAMEKNGEVDKGIYIINGQLEDVLKKNGLERIKVSVGDKFDPNIHESLGEMELPDKEKAESGTVAVEVEAGYQLNGKVVRPARVKLAK